MYGKQQGFLVKFFFLLNLPDMLNENFKDKKSARQLLCLAQNVIMSKWEQKYR
jgi:hypothetical protein